MDHRLQSSPDRPFAPSESRPSLAQQPPGRPKLLDRVRDAIRVRHYSPRTELAYVHWIKRYIFFHKVRHPADMGKDEVSRFLSHLAEQKHVSASTQNQALHALLFLYRKVLDVEVGLIDGVVRAKLPERLPIVLTHDEVKQVIVHLDGVGSWFVRCCTDRECGCWSV